MQKHKYENLSVRKYLEEYKDGTFEPGYDESELVELRRAMTRASYKDWFCPWEELQDRLKRIVNILSQITDDEILDKYFVSIENYIGTPLTTPPKTYDKLTLQAFNDDPEKPKSLCIHIHDKSKEFQYSICTERNNWKPEALCSRTDMLITWLNNWSQQTKHNKFVVFISIDNPKRWSQWHSGNTDSVYYSPFFETIDEVNTFIEQLKEDYPNSNLLDPQARDYFIKYTVIKYDETNKKGFKTLCEMLRAYRPYADR